MVSFCRPDDRTDDVKDSRHVLGGEWSRCLMGQLFLSTSGNSTSRDLHFAGVREDNVVLNEVVFSRQNTTLEYCLPKFVMIKGTFDYPYCHEVTKYEKMVKVGQGTFGFVS